MKRKSILALILVTIIVVSISLIGCNGNSSKTDTGNNAAGNPNTANNAAGNPNIGNNDTTGNSDTNAGNNVGDNANNDIKNAIEAGKDNAEAAGNSLKYSAMNFRDDVVNAGYQIKDSADSKKNYFTGNETDYLMGSDVVRVYEYNSATDLEGDINRISQNGLTISGTDANYTRKPYFYRKGNSLIVYEGNEPAYTDQFKTMYGNTLRP